MLDEKNFIMFLKLIPWRTMEVLKASKPNIELEELDLTVVLFYFSFIYKLTDAQSISIYILYMRTFYLFQ